MSVLKKFILSYLSVGLLACAIIGLLFSRVVVSAIIEQYQTLQINKLNAITDDLSQQIETLSDISYTVQATSYYPQSYIQQSPLAAKDMLQDLAKYQGYSQIVDSLFFFYRDDPHSYVYFPQASSYLNVYLRNYCGISDPEPLGAWFQELKRPSVWLDQGLILLAYPVRTLFRNNIDATLCFVVSERSLYQRMNRVAGGLEGSVRIVWNETEILNNIGRDAPAPLSAQRDGLTVQYLYRQENYETLKRYTRLIMLILFFSLVVVAIASAFAAHMSYQPIRRIVNKNFPHGIKGNEMEMLDDLIRVQHEEVLMNRNRLQAQMRESERQRAVLKRQWMYLNILDTRWQQTKEDDESAGFMHKYYMLFAFKLLSGKIDVLRKSIEDHRDNEMDFYLYIQKRIDGYIVAVNYAHESQSDSCRSQIETMAECSDCEIVFISEEPCFEASQLGERLKRLVANARAAVTVQDTPMDVANEESGADQQDIIKYIEENAFDPALSQTLVAGKFYVTEKTVLSVIKKQTGMSYIEYLTNLRVEHAKQLLQEEDITVAEVCERAGYSSIPHFIRTFKGIVGETPAKYKKKEEERRKRKL